MRSVKTKVKLLPCPKCGNRNSFNIHSAQVGEDCCEVWAECKCGYDPSEDKWGSRFEDVWGGTGDNNCVMALEVWNMLIDEQQNQKEQ